MAWEWVPPVAAGASGILGAGIGATVSWITGRQGRAHAEEVARQNSAAQLALAREARRAQAYEEILNLVLGMTAAVGEITAIWRDREDPQLAGLDTQIKVASLVGLYGSQAMREAHKEWWGHVVKLLDNHREIQAHVKNGGQPDREPGLWQQQDVERPAMREAAERLRDQMNKELAS